MIQALTSYAHLSIIAMVSNHLLVLLVFKLIVDMQILILRRSKPLTSLIEFPIIQSSLRYFKQNEIASKVLIWEHSMKSTDLCSELMTLHW